jgi:alpha-L-fucosidase
MDMYYKSVGRNCNLLLNANIDRNGLVPEPDLQRYREFGAEIRRRFGQALAETSGRGDEVVLRLPQPGLVDHVITMEQIAEGERVREYVVEGQTGGDWKELCRGQSLGHKRIDTFPAADVAAIRWRCLRSVGEPRIRRLAAYRVAR